MSEFIQTIPRQRKPRGHGSERKAEILAAATRIFLQEGVAGATMRRIASEVGVSPTALYVYFPDKEAILEAIAQAWFFELLGVLQASQANQTSVEGAFRAGLRAYVEFGLARPDSYRLTFLSRPDNRDGKLPCDDIPEADYSFAVLQSGVEAMMQAGQFRPGDSTAIAETIWAALHGLTVIVIDQAEHLKTAPNRLIEQMLDMVVRGFG